MVYVVVLIIHTNYMAWQTIVWYGVWFSYYYIIHSQQVYESNCISLDYIYILYNGYPYTYVAL